MIGKWIILSALLVTAACDSPASPVQQVPVEHDMLAEPDLDLRPIARALAIAMDDPATRGAVRNAMRRSPWGQHVVDVAEFVLSPQGRPAASRLADVLGIPDSALVVLIGTYPPLDLYIPDQVTRRSWRGAGEVVVRTSLDFDASPIYSFDADGNEPDMGRTFDATLLIEPALERVKRYDPQPWDKEVIEGPGAKVIRAWLFFDDD